MGVWEEKKGPIYKKWKEYWYNTHPVEIADYTWEYLFTGGKEIRARLFCELWHYLSPDSEVCVELAFAMECIHVASLILDDSPWMDRATERRGKRTLHLQFSDRKALLICHDVMKMVYEIWLSCRPEHVLQEEWKTMMRLTLERLTIGQYYDLERKGTLVEMASLKTGVLFGCVTQTVAACIQLDPLFWKEWGIRLGILFQWVDDWNDREEDRIQDNRNAFNEDHISTSMIYNIYWSQLHYTIGSSWFQLPFGQYMDRYFSSIPFLINSESLTSSYTLSTLSQFEPISISFVLPPPVQLHRKFVEKKKEHEFSLPFETSEEMIQTLLTMTNRQDEFQPLQTYLWDLNETEWDHVPEIQDWIKRVQEETELSKTINK
jgi:hypothetical protein